MRDYRAAYDEFSVPALAREVLSGSFNDGINAAVECCDRWAEGSRIALNWIGQNLVEETVPFEALRDQSQRFARVLHARGIGRGDVVSGLLPRIPELLVVVLGTWGSAQSISHSLPRSAQQRSQAESRRRAPSGRR